MSESELKLLVINRKHIRSNITRIYNQVTTSFTELLKAKKVSLVSELKNLNTEVQNINAKITDLKWSLGETSNDVEIEKKLEEEFESCSGYREKISDAIAILEESLSIENVQPDASFSHNNFIGTQLKCPTAPLPVFHSKEGESLEKFFHQFETTVSRYNYSDYDRFLLLKQQIKGRASMLIESLEIDSQSYDCAKELLCQALASPLTQKFNILKKMSEMKLGYDVDPFEYISVMKSIKESFSHLKIDIDTVMQFFFWNGLNDTFKAQLVQITNKTKPSLQDIFDNYFDASERYINVKKKFKDKRTSDGSKSFSPKKNSSKSETANFAAEVNYTKTIPKTVPDSVPKNVSNKTKSTGSFLCCNLCFSDGKKQVDHTIYKCSKYPNNSDKIRKLKSLNGCIKCTNLNHSADKCNFRFNRKCSNCHGWHFYFLCEKVIKPEKPCNSTGYAFKKPTGASKTTKPNTPINKSTGCNEKSDTSNGTVSVDIFNSFSGRESILPTFTFNLEGCDQVVRVMADSGCQSNFILTDLARKANCRVVRENFPLVINGFNSSQEYLTDLVQVDLKLGTKTYQIEALLIPEIKTSLKLPGLTEVVKGFIERGYKLADERLIEESDKLSDIGLVLGIDSMYCLNLSTVSFGDKTPSTYYDTSIGTVLCGNIPRILNNLNYLPDLNNTQSTNLTSVQPNIDEALYNSTTKHESGDLGDCVQAEYPHAFSAATNFAILDENGQIVEKELQKATAEILNQQCLENVHYDSNEYNEASMEVNDRLVNYVLDNTLHQENGRLIMPLMWNGSVSHMLGNNKNLAKKILNSNLRKYSKTPDVILKMDEVFRVQEESGIIEKVHNLNQYMTEHPEASFLAHMPILKLDRQTTKVRMVFLSNLCEQVRSSGTKSISHNQAMLPGPCLNKKLTTSVLLLRFDKSVIIFDVVKAFNQIALNEIDQARLLFFWFKNVEANNYEVVAYRNLRLPFGLRCSPSILMLALYKILILDAEHDTEELKTIKQMLYDLVYMDNAAYTSNSISDLYKAYEIIPKIFKPYCFDLQQFVTNDESLQSKIDEDSTDPTPEKVKLFGLLWNRITDNISVKKYQLDNSASTKRTILKSLASNFDPFNIADPLLNRARLFMRELQIDADAKWDSELSPERLKEWSNITKQVNHAPEISIPRFVGKRGGKFKLISFTDASKLMYGTVVYIQDLSTGEVSFLMSKNRLNNKQLQSKTIPALEFQGISLGVETLMDVYTELCGPSCVQPIEIAELNLYSDSLVALSWINNYVDKLDKMSKRSVFIMNRLNHILKLCDTFPVTFRFVSGIENPADYTTRPISYNQLVKTNYWTGPKFLKDCKVDACLGLPNQLEVTIPNSNMVKAELQLPSENANVAAPNSPIQEHIQEFCGNVEIQSNDQFFSLNKFSTFSRAVTTVKLVYKFIYKLKLRLHSKDPSKYEHFLIETDESYNDAFNYLVKEDQKLHFSEVLKYFESGSKTLKDIPNIVTQLNLYIDQTGILRVKSKLGRKNSKQNYAPILLSKKSRLSELIILEMHCKRGHLGCYSLLSELRKQFWITHYYSVVKKILRKCVTCRRMNNKTIQLNQNNYREFRTNPPNVPYRYIFIDHIGPYFVKRDGKKVKVWLLIFTCLFTRAINLKICYDLSVKQFLRAFQIHTFEYGVPSLCLSDAGSQIVAGANLISSYINDSETLEYFKEHGVEFLKFEHYLKGCNELGSLVESCVKLTKKLLYGSIKNNILDLPDFEFFVSQTTHLVNRRPIAFKDGLRDNNFDVPDPITPEEMVRGFKLISLNLIPELQSVDDLDPTWKNDNPVDIIKTSYHKLKKARSNLNELYQSEFLTHLVTQAINKKDRYKPVSHKTLQVGDVVLLKDNFLKAQNYPMGIVKKIITNDISEVTGALVFKGGTKELVKRHVTSLIPLLSQQELCNNDVSEIFEAEDDHAQLQVAPSRAKRKTAIEAEKRSKQLFDQDLA